MTHRKLPSIRISRLYKMMDLSLCRKFRENGFDITNEQEIILRTLHSAGEMNQTDLAASTGQDRNNLSRTVTLLEGKGYVARKKAEQDKRVILVSLTPEGVRIRKKLQVILDDWKEHIFFPGISPEELETFSCLAESLMKNLEAHLRG